MCNLHFSITNLKLYLLFILSTNLDYILITFFPGRYYTINIRKESLTLRSTHFKQFFNTRQTLSNIVSNS